MPPTPNTLLLLVDGSSQREAVISHSPFTIGRSPDRDLVLPHPYISRNHAEIVFEGGQFHLVDCGSKSGCYVNSKRVTRQTLAPNDMIRLGTLEGPILRFGKAEDTTSVLGELLHQVKPASDLEKLRWFLDAARKLNMVGAVHEILISLIETTMNLTRVERGYVFLKDADGNLQLSVGRNIQMEPLQDDSTISHSAIQQAIHSASEFIVTDTLAAEAGSPSASIVAQNLRTVICIPLRKRSTERGTPVAEILGMLYLDSRQQRQTLMRVDSDLLRTIAMEAAVLVENASLASAEEAARRYREELSIAAGIQQGLMTVRMPELAYARVLAHSVPCKEIGGDFYDVIATESALYVVVADISGKGVSAALLGSTLQGLVHAQVLAGLSLPQIARFSNQYICAKSISKYATLVLLKVTPDGSVEYLNCGHVQPLRHRREKITVLRNSNLPVGLLPDAIYSSEIIQLEPGERFVLFTDGVTEAEDPSGEFFGEARLESSVLQGASIQSIFEQVQLFMDTAPANDDCTLVEVCYGQCS
ncbi:SpoIIE family protein phosphatase [Acidipila rosea]|uniref:Serine phosphatase RsbU (Regulator of sigma subunit) n=1 Tax=Acidipila rosea TaxID=768535 RepID=A0A4R1LG82_9BACT|nr:SpoIIE family protein phosphatase [Acidipila rosea]MBW4025975.1 SpoIIE family protein phosphatase [Acidobacteriota bacterium]MBW4044106.1 SpoIIE family protein phosphatase [Acidobacteriota bacterium]TCK75863.1 serine phosphatase RsbU (regulator of sigma subunit) [Acidipila rosea]